MERTIWVGLAQRAKDGDREAFEELVEAFKRPLCSVIFPLLNDWHLTQDVAQEAFAVVFESLPRMKEPGRFRAWLFRIARNKAITRYRARRRKRLLLVPTPAGVRVRGVVRAAESRRHSLDGGVGPSETALARVRRAVMALPNDYGSLLLMRYSEGMTYAEIGEVVGRSPKAVGSMVYRARVLARDLLVKAGLDWERIVHEM